MSCLSHTPPLGGLSPPQGVFQGHAAHLVEWSAKLRPKGSWGTCISQGVITFFYTAFTAHSGRRAPSMGASGGVVPVGCAPYVRPDGLRSMVPTAGRTEWLRP